MESAASLRQLTWIMQWVVATGLVFAVDIAGTLAGDPITALAISPEGESVVSGSCAGLVEFQLPDLRAARRLSTEVEAVHDLRFSVDGSLLAVAGGTPGQYGLVEILHWPGGEVVARVRAHDDVVFAVDWSPDSEYLATASLDRSILVSHVSSRTESARIDGHSKGVTGIVWIALSSGESGGRTRSMILSSSLDQTLRLWSIDVSTGEAPRSSISGARLIRTMDQHTGAIGGIVMRPRQATSEPIVAASWGSDRTVRFWQPESGRMLRFARVASPVSTAVWSGDGERLIVAEESGEIADINLATAVVEKRGATGSPVRAMLLDAELDDLIVGDATGHCFRFTSGSLPAENHR